MRLIDAEKLPLEPKEANQFIPYEYASGWNDMLLNVLKAEQVDALPVVRCRECKHLNVVNRKELYAHCPKTNTVFLPFELDTREHFCSYGERKEGADNG